MDSINVTLITFVVICAGAVTGFALKKWLSENHLAAPAQDAVKLATGVVATLAALVLGLLVASGKQAFDNRAAEARTFVINLTLLDRAMRLYQPPLTAERQALATFAKAMRSRLWEPNPTTAKADVLLQLDQLRNSFRQLQPASAQDKSLQDRYMSLSDGLILAANELLEQDVNSIPVAFIVIVDAWLAIIFLGFGLFAPLNRVSAAALAVGAGAVAMALFMIVEMSEPFQGFITISPRMMDNAVAQISTA